MTRANPYIVDVSTPEKRASVEWATAVLQARIAGMVNENKYRLRRGEQVAGSGDAFEEEIEFARQSLAAMGCTT